MHLEGVIEKWLGVPLLEARPLSGGDINQVYRLRMSDSTDFVLKLNAKERYPEMFEKEGKGLGLLSSAGCNTPRVQMCFEEGKNQYLILELIEEGRPTSTSWESFGQQLGTLHLQSNDFYGLDHDNYIGSLEQVNKQEKSWAEFFISNRLLPLIKKASERNLLGSSHWKSFESLFVRLPGLIPEEKPALLHGDLWSGNLMFDHQGTPVFIDPAVYFGHREIDIAMTRMFGGFNERFLSTYNEVRPLETSWESRIELHNLYPTLVHLVLFGRSYLGGVERVLRRFA